ncbi:thiosulfate/3-mercaptopyruvate sulfurtransferase [Friedmanniella luteola]|uniref:Thiosulfate/3-mercaptopyruvate sulfurtransferase n=1 Tax=Friedmanniella luteola TaxID=546871 RepID=A0A1H1RZE4_9ACTN|nr:sulfurtransferase [Friedmanniella luteola]SDS41092.1 thiosulfate/3-mercaptopyruvate sulfurtransferase [Friedmanniella luteola]
MSPEPTTPLISVDELAVRLQDPGPVVLADVRWTLGGPPGQPEYEAGHLPGAHWVDLEHELSGPVTGAGGRHPLPAADVLAAALSRIGVRTEVTVVVYDAATSLAAARLWWLLVDAGHPDVRVLDGGFAAWQRAGHPVETGPDRGAPAGDFVPRPGQLGRVDATGLADLLGSGTPVVDVRAAERFTGATEPYDPVAGHIPGAVNRPSPQNQTPEGRFRPAAEIAERFAGLDEPVLYCGSGITAAHTLLALRSAGLDGRIYPGSWSDWVSDASRPVATGPA